MNQNNNHNENDENLNENEIEHSQNNNSNTNHNNGSQQNRQGPRGPQQRGPQPRRKRNDFGVFIVIALLLLLFWFMFSQLTKEKIDTLTYETFIELVETNPNSIKNPSATPVGGENYGLYEIKGSYIKTVEGKEVETAFKLVVTDTQLNKITIDYKLSINMRTLSSNIWLSILLNFLPILLLIGVIIYISKASGNNKAFDFAKSKAKLAREKTVTFNDVAGCDEEKNELVEVVDFLKNPKKYVDMGARIPKGILLCGPPGTGKT
ncbi:MAG: hypothetical protein ACRC5M_03415, partial [Anaeroplasmataceae bacterium]